MINVESVKNFCKDDISLIENYNPAIADKEQTWQCHHRREIETPRKQLIELGEYFHRPASELIFLTEYEHKSLHNKGKYVSSETRKKLASAKKGNKNRLGKPCSEEAKRKISESNKGSPSWNKGKHLSEEAKRKLSESLKGKTSWNKGKKMSEEAKQKLSESQKGNKYRLGKLFTEETKRKMSAARQGLKFFNNGIINIKVKECPAGFVKGRLKKVKQI